MPRPLLDTSPGYLERAFHFNVATAHALVRAATPVMLEGGGGAVVNISSTMGRAAGRGYLAYGTAKAALAHYTRLAARDLAPRIRVNAVAVGSTATSALELVLDSDELRTAMEEATPLKRIADPSEIAAAVLFLASPAASYVTGKVLEADGGLEVAQPRHGAARPVIAVAGPAFAPSEEGPMTYKVVAWSTGNVGRHALAGIDAHPDLELVGLFVSNPDKVGRDAGELAGLDRPLGVAASGDADALLALRPGLHRPHGHGRQPADRGTGRPGRFPARRGQRGLQRAGLLAVPGRRATRWPNRCCGRRPRAARPSS